MNTDQITPLILTLNEQNNIGRTLSALEWARQVIVVDSYSTDETVKLASGYSNVTLVQRAFDDHTSQWNFGLEQVLTPWVLALDADYQLSDRLVAEIRSLSPEDETAGYKVGFEYRIFGRSLRASVYPPRVVLFGRQVARYVSDGHTQLLKVEGDVRHLQLPIYHDDRKPLSRWIRSQDQYARLEAKHLVETPKGELSFQDRLRLCICVAPFAMFFYLLFGRGLVFDGWRGWYYTAQRVIAELLLSIRLIEAKQAE